MVEVEEKGKEGVSGKKGEGRETCLNTVGKKALLEFKVKNSPPKHLELWADRNKWNIKKHAN